MVEVSEIFFGNSYALNDQENLKAFVKKVKNVKGWYCGFERSMGRLYSQLCFKIEYKSREDFEKNFTIMNTDFVKGLELLGFTIADFDETRVKVSVLEYKKTTTFREWRKNHD